MGTILKPISTIYAHLGLEPNGPTHYYFTQRCKEYMEKYVPKRDKILRNTAYIEGVDTIVYPQDYARYQYKGMREDGTHVIQHWTTPGTGPYWDKRMVSNDLDDIIEETKK